MHDTIIPPSTVRLCIPGLPSLTDRMIKGGMYALIAEMPPARFPILTTSLGGALSQDMQCTVILPSQPESFVERIGSFGQFDAARALDDGKLQVFVLQQNFAKNIFRFGAESFAKELDHFEIPQNSYLIFDQADELFSLHDVSLALEQVGVLKHWFAERGITALLVFSRLTPSATDTLHAMMDQLSGIVRIGGDRDGLDLVFDYWQSPEGTIAAKHHPLHTLENGLYRVSARAQPSEQIEEEELPDDGEPRFFYMDPDLGSLAKQLPGIWQHVDTLVGMMHATRDARSATVILSFQRDTNLRQLAEAAHTLRLSLGRRARIVVRENGASLRYQNEALLLRLGVSLVVHRDVSASRLPLLLASLSGQIFDRNVDINFEVALASVIPSGMRGYLLPNRFVREAELIVERGETLNIPCALVIGIPARDTTVSDVLARVSMARPGDLVSSDGESCFLFLNGCPESVLLMTIERLLGESVDAAFAESRFVIRRHEIQAELAALARSASRNELPDYSLLQAAGSAAEEVAVRAQPPLGETRRAAPVPVPSHALIPQAPPAAASEPVPVQMPPMPFFATAKSAQAPAQAVAPSRPAPASKPVIGPAAAMPAVPDAAPATPAAAIPATQEPAAPTRFQYSGKSAATFGKNEAPRATRAAPRPDAEVALHETPTSTT